MGGAGAVAKAVANTITTVFTTVANIFTSISNIIQVIKKNLSDLLGVADKVLNKLQGFRESGTQSALDLLPNLQFNPNAPGNADAPAARAARINRQAQQKVQVQIIADKEGLVNAVVSDEAYRQSIDNMATKIMKDTARATRR